MAGFIMQYSGLCLPVHAFYPTLTQSPAMKGILAHLGITDALKQGNYASLTMDEMNAIKQQPTVPSQ